MVELITDRTQQDVDRVKELWSKGWNNLSNEEQVEWSNGMKGAYNYQDLNRVERAVAELSEILELGLVTKTDWGVTDIPTETDMTRYLANIGVIRANGGYRATTPTLPTKMCKLTYFEANALEQILLDIQETAPLLLRCGELFCGEV